MSELIGLGRTSKEVAFELGIAPATVRVLQSRARKKLERATGSGSTRPESPGS